MNPFLTGEKLFFEESLAVGGMKLSISIIRLLQSRTDKNMKVNGKNPENAQVLFLFNFIVHTLGNLIFKFSSIPLGKQFCDNCNHWQCENLISMKALRTYLS